MRPILLSGQTRALTKIKYNLTGDILFSCSKDSQPCAWYADNGERIGTYDGHVGAVWDIDVSQDSTKLLTAGADATCKLWDVMTGKCLFTWKFKSAVRSVSFAEGGQMAVLATDDTMNQKPSLHIIQIALNLDDEQSSDIQKLIVMPDSKATICRWGSRNQFVFVGHENGQVSKWNPNTGELVQVVKEHTAQIQDMQFAVDKSYFITASKDTFSKIFDGQDMKVLKVFPTDRPVNAAALSPLRPHVIVGGGQEAMNVTTTSTKQGKFEVFFYHKVFEEEIGRVKGHFGPINTLAFHPSGYGFASGSEDGYIRLHYFDPDYYEFKYNEEEGDLF